MIYRIYGQKDTTIYEHGLRRNQNTGIDSVLEVTKFFDEDTDENWIGNSRILTQFDLSPISSLISSGDISGNKKFYLNLTSVDELEVRAEYQLNVHQVSGSWINGLGKYNDNPKNTSGCNWVYRNDNEAWSVSSAQIFNGIREVGVPTEGIVLYEGFSEGTGSLFLTQSINDIRGNSPSISISDNRLFISASNFAGTTLVFPAQLDENQTYGVQFQIDPGSFDDIQFRVLDADGVLKADDDYEGFVGRITTPSTQSFDLTSTTAGEYQLQFTFFDGSGDGTSTTGSFDEIYVYEKTGNTIAYETFAFNKGGFLLRNVVKNTNDELPRMFVSESKLNLYADNIGGGDATYIETLSTDLEYTLSCEVEPGDYPEIGFTIYDPNGLKYRNGVTSLSSSFTTPQTQSIVFTPQIAGDYIFAYTFFDSGSAGASGSLDNFKLVYSGSIPQPPQIEAGYYKNEGGATWYTSSVSNTTISQTFNKYTKDLNVEVTDYVNDWLSGSRENNGFLIKRPAAQESGSIRYGSSKFFSNETNTIYVPTLEVRWATGSFETGSLSELTDDNITLYVKNILTEYKETSKAKLRLVGRAKYPQRTFADSYPYTTIKYLPETTYYQVKDVETNLSIIPYDTTYTKVNCDSTGNYFDFWFNTLQPERFYRFDFRVDRNGKNEYFEGPIFKVVR